MLVNILNLQEKSLYSKLAEETNIRKVAKSFAFSLTTLEEVKIF